LNEPATPVAVSADGATLLIGDGPELLAYRADGVPLWTHFGDAPIVGVGTGAGFVLAVDADGALTRLTQTGDVHDLVPLGGPLLAATVHPSGAVAAVTRGGIVVLAGAGPPRQIPLPHAAAVAFGPGAHTVGVGTGSGQFVVLDVATGAKRGSVQLEGRVAAVDWSHQGSWVAGAGANIARIDPDASAIVHTHPTAEPVRAITTSADGLATAALQGKGRISVYELQGAAHLGDLTVTSSTPGGLTFGRGLTLVVALEDGDASTVDLLSRSQGRTEPQAGRGRNAWRLENKVHSAALSGAQASHSAGGGPIASYVPPSAEAGIASKRGLIAGCIGCAGFAAFMGAMFVVVVALTYVVRFR